VPRHHGELCPPPILPRCLSRCPDPGCPTAVVQDLVDAAADGADKDRYAPVRTRDEEAEVGASAIQCDEKRYVVLIEDDVHDRQGEDTRGGRRGAVRPAGLHRRPAAALQVGGGGRRGPKEGGFFDDWRIRDAVGLPAYGGPPIATARRRQ